MRDEGAGAALAAAGFTAFALAVALSRLAGDRAIARGRRAAVRTAGLVTAAGAALVVAAPGAVTAVFAWALVGAGVAVVAPAVLGAAPAAAERRDDPATTPPSDPEPSAPGNAEPSPPRDPARSPGVAIAAVTTIGYLGSFTGPPAIGALAELVGLSAALGLLVVAGVAIVALASKHDDVLV